MKKLTYVIFSILFFQFLPACTTRQINTEVSHPQFKELSKKNDNHEGIGKKWVIASQGEETSKIANQIFIDGGNIVDAAVAASFALAVERPQSTGIGGGGFVMFYLAKENKMIALDFREKAPFKATEKMFLDTHQQVIPESSISGAKSSATPGMVAGIYELHHKYGKLPWRTCLQPAIKLARNGFPIYNHLFEAIKDSTSEFNKYKSSSQIFLHGDGTPLNVGEYLIQIDLAKTLETISKKKRGGFYKGWVAKAIINTHTKYGGILTQKDLNLYNSVYRTPVVLEYNGFKIFSMPPPSSGGVHIAQILNFLSIQPNPGKQNSDPMDPLNIDQTAKAMQFAFYDRSIYLGDPDFSKVPINYLLSEKHAKNVSEKIQKPGAISSSEIGDAPVFKLQESPETTHFSLADNEGNILSSTQSINGWFGSGIVVEGAGFILNNEMDDFSIKPGTPNKFGVVGGSANKIEPGKRPLSSMAPTIVLKGGNAILGIGTPSGSRIISCITLSLLNYLKFNLPLNESIEYPRYHHQWVPDELVLEPNLFHFDTISKLTKLGYKVATRDLGCKVQGVTIETDHISKDSILHGVSDRRGEGSVITDLSKINH